MESPVLTLVVALFFVVNVESQPAVIPPPSQLPEQPPQRHPRLITPPSVPQPLPHTPTQPLPHPSPRLPLPPPSPRKHLQPVIPNHGNYNPSKNLSPPRGRAKLNMGKKIGLMFIGVAAILQFCFLAFLLISRRQLLKSEEGY